MQSDPSAVRILGARAAVVALVVIVVAAGVVARAARAHGRRAAGDGSERYRWELEIVVSTVVGRTHEPEHR